VGEAEVVVDVEVGAAGRRRPGRPGVAVRLRLLGNVAGLDEVGRLAQVGDRAVELPQRDVAMAAVAVEPDVVGVFLDSARVRGDRLAEAAEIGLAPAEPDDGVGGAGVLGEVVLGPGQVRLQHVPPLGGDLRREERHPQERGRLGRLEVAVVPGDVALVAVLHVAGLADAVVLARVDHELGGMPSRLRAW
jgi:hypothetical protein